MVAKPLNQVTAQGKAPPGAFNLYNQLSSTDSVETWKQTAVQLLDGREPERAKLVLETLLHRQESELEAYLLLAKACISLGPTSYDEAIAAARKGHQLVQHRVPAEQAASTVTLAVALGTKARVPTLLEAQKAAYRSEAVQLLTDLATKAKGEALLHYNLALLLVESGGEQAAVEQVKAGLELASAKGQQDTVLLCLMLLALLLSARHQPQAALSVLSAASSPGTPSSSPSTPAHTAGMAAPAAATGPKDVLLARIQSKLLAAVGDTPRALEVLAHCVKRLGFSPPAGATGTNSRSEEQGASEAQMWQDLAIGFAEQGEYQDALFCAEQSLKIWPWKASSHHAAGYAHESVGNLDQAIDCYNTSLSLDPHHAPTLLRLGAAYCRRGHLSDVAVARDLLLDALRYEPGSAEGWYHLGLACKAMKHRQEAEKHLLTAIMLATSSPVLPYSQLPLALPGN